MNDWYENWKAEEKMLKDLKIYCSKLRICRKCVRFAILNENGLCNYCNEQKE